MLPINIDSLIFGKAVENNRIEYKKGWDPEPILHTICAFANDYEGYYGGYILIGIDTENGKPILPPVGIDANEVDKIQQEIVEYCKKYINPKYVPHIEPYIHEEKNILVIWAFGDHDAPYDCVEHIYAKDSKSRVTYIRKGSTTIKASPKEIKEISAYNQFVSFDERVNHSASINDLNYSLMIEYLREIGSSLTDISDELTVESLAESLKILGGPKEDTRPINAGLLFFNDNPSNFIPYSYIELDYLPDPTGNGMINKTFTGPINRQLKDALSYIKNNYVASMTRKVDYQAEAIINYNYPFPAIEEILTNAVLHKSYQINEPVNIRITKSQIEITSFPGFDHSISDYQIENFRLSTRRYRNRRIGEFLRELHLAESKNTGYPKAIQSMERNGSPKLKFEMDSNREFLTVIIPIHPLFLDSNNNKTDYEIKTSLREKILNLLRTGSYTLSGLANDLGYASIPNSLRTALKKLVEEGLVFKSGKIYHL